ncbi:MAG: hypothetical protein QOI69_1396, partial [Pseudonocardiales bacterium]|nr:hypothetical protein [Pseudonocardiales bacterium]
MHRLVAVEAQAKERVVLGDDFRARAGEVQSERRHVPAEVVDVEDEFLGEGVGVAPDSPPDPRVDQAVLVPGRIDRGHPR